MVFCLLASSWLRKNANGSTSSSFNRVLNFSHRSREAGPSPGCERLGFVTSSRRWTRAFPVAFHPNLAFHAPSWLAGWPGISTTRRRVMLHVGEREGRGEEKRPIAWPGRALPRTTGRGSRRAHQPSLAHEARERIGWGKARRICNLPWSSCAIISASLAIRFASTRLRRRLCGWLGCGKGLFTGTGRMLVTLRPSRQPLVNPSFCPQHLRKSIAPAWSILYVSFTLDTADTGRSLLQRAGSGSQMRWQPSQHALLDRGSTDDIRHLSRRPHPLDFS